MSGWNSSGCERRSNSTSQTICLCNHLTHFGLLVDVSGEPLDPLHEMILTIISYLGCGVSSIFLAVTILTYLSFKKLRKDYPSKILINLSIALLGLSMVFLVNSSLSTFSNYGLCISTAATLHYFLLASFTWMAVEAVHMYLALIKVFNTYIPFYLLKFCAFGWGIPLVIVSLVLAIDKDVYRLADTSSPFCWMQNDSWLYYVTVLAFIALVMLGNMIVFIMVLIQIRKMKAMQPEAKNRSALQDLRAVASLTVLLGFTWLIGLFTFGPGDLALTYLFVIFSTLQGFFIFLFHCLMKEKVRKQWKARFCRKRRSLSGHPRKNLNSQSQTSNSTVSMWSSSTLSSTQYRYQWS